MTKGIVLSLYDFTGEALRPWAEAGYECYAFDIQHSKENVNTDTYEGGGTIEYVHLDLHNIDNLEAIRQWFHDSEIPVVLGMAFPVCTDLAVSGAAHFKRKAERDPEFQIKASNYARWCDWLFDAMEIPYFIENPVSRLATLWRKPNYTFHPYEYGGYIPDDQAEHPRWPEYIAPKDAYPKKTCLWTGGGFVMPERKAVPVPQGYSTQHKKLGGKSQRTKDIRSATPRGFAKAVYEANKVKETA
jgi:hypothetical protein